MWPKTYINNFLVFYIANYHYLQQESEKPALHKVYIFIDGVIFYSEWSEYIIPRRSLISAVYECYQYKHKNNYVASDTKYVHVE